MLKSYVIDLRRGLIVLMALAWCVISFGQNQGKIDSLVRELPNTHADTDRVNLMNELSDLFWHDYKYTDARKYADEAMSLSRNSDYLKGVATAYYNLANIYLANSELDEGFKNCINALDLYKQINYKYGVGNAYNTLGILNFRKNNWDEAYNNYQVSIKVREEINDEKGLASAYNNLGNLLAHSGKSEEALNYYTNSLQINEKINDKRGIALMKNNVGTIYLESGNYPLAMNYFLGALKMSEEIDDKRIIGMAASNLGSIYSYQNNPEEAIKYYSLSLKMKQAIGDKNGIAMTNNNIGGLYLEAFDYVEALKYLIPSAKRFEEVGNKYVLLRVYLNMTTCYREIGNLQEAMNYCQKSLDISKDIKDEVNIGNSHLAFARIYQMQDNLDEAKHHYHEALQHLKSVNSKSQLLDIYSDLSGVSCAAGDYKEALDYFKAYAAYKDSLLSETNNKAIVELQTKYDVEKKDIEIRNLESAKQVASLELSMKDESLKRIRAEKAKIEIQNLLAIKQLDLMENEQKLQEYALQQKETNLLVQKAETEKRQKEVQLLSKESELQKLQIKKQTLTKNYLLGGLGLVTLLSFLTYNNYVTKQKLKLQTLRNKIASDLHDDVGSTLSSIAIFSDMAQNQSKEIGPLLKTINESSRKMLDAMGDIVWTINPENDQLEKIILRMKSFAFDLLGAKNINFHFVADEGVSQVKLPMEVRKNLYLIFKEATNNMVKYSDADKAFFSIKEEDKFLSMTIHDNGKGFDPEMQTLGNGLKNMQKRAEEIGAKLIVMSAPGKGTNIQLKIAV